MSIVCTRIIARTLGRALPILTGVLFVLVACRGGADTSDPTSVGDIDAPVPTASPIEATATFAFTPEPTRSAAFEALLAPGPTIAPPDGIFFQNSNDIWYLPGSEPARRVVDEDRLGPWTQTVDGARIALVRYREVDGNEVEELVLVNNDGSTSDPVYGPAPTSGAGSDPAIVALDWSWDGQLLAVILSDGTIATMQFADDPFRTRPPLDPIQMPAGDGEPIDIAWAPSGAGIAYLIAGDTGNALYVSPTGDPAGVVIEPGGTPSRSVQAFEWLPGRGRLVFVEAAASTATRLPGSVFTIAPDGTLLELLLSAGQFAPAATIQTLRAGPNGSDLAFTVYVPDAQGQQVFQSLWILSIDSGELTQVPVETGYRVADVRWSSTGLIWRGIDRNAGVPTEGATFTSDEPFVLGRFDPASGTSTIIFQSTLAE